MYARLSWILALAVLAGCASVPKSPPAAPSPPSPQPQLAQPESVQSEATRPETPDPVADVPMTVAPPSVAPVPVAPEPVAPKPVAAPVAAPVTAAPQVRQPATAPPRPTSVTTTRPESTSKAEAAPAPAIKAPAEAPAAALVSLYGRIELVGTRTLKADAKDLSDVVVYYTPDVLVARPRPQSETIYTRSRGFDPGLLVVPVGSSVAFPNGDPIRHNVYSLTPGAAFDLGLYGEGETRSHVFDRAGVVLVQCNVHHAMEALVLVLDTPHYTRVDAEGRYQLADLPAGSGTLTVWHPRAAQISSGLRLPLTAPQDRRLTLNKPRAGR